MVPFKKNILEEACKQFHDPNFFEMLDENKYLLGFNNGVIDFKAPSLDTIFRNGYPQDYISKSTQINYTPLDHEGKDRETIAKIHVFMSQVFPDEELRAYMWAHFASVLIGGNMNQKFNIYTGVGRNGKSLIVYLMEKILGQYKATCPLTLISGKRVQTGGTCSELLELKGIRYAVAQENEKELVLNEGTVKEFTGNTDKLQARGLYQSKTTVFEPTFKLTLCTNNLPIVKSNDNGIWRRLDVNPFESLFCENPHPTREQPHQFKVDLKMNEVVDSWKEVFMAMLVELAYETRGALPKCKKVSAASDAYRASQDHISEFIGEFVVEEQDSFVKLQDLASEYRSWLSSTHGIKLTQTSDLTNFMDKMFGQKTKKGWKDVRLIRSDDDMEIGSNIGEC